MPISVNVEINSQGTKYTVTSFIARGGEGEVWKVNDNNGNDYILKILDPSKRLEDKKRNIKALFERYPLLKGTLEKQDFFAAFPVAVYEEDGKFGYIARFCKGKEINELMMDGTLENMSIDERIKLIEKISDAAAWIHSNGLCYHDFSHKNFIYDTEAGRISVIDCDNVTPNAFLDQAAVVGTAFYIAPEVAFGEKKPSIESDLYALAVLFFKIMVGKCDSPYHGNLLYKAAAGCLPQDMMDAAEYEDEFGKDWILFIFDDKNKQNAIDVDMFRNSNEKAIQQSFIDNWNETPNWMKELFIRAFNNPFDKEARRNRPVARDWRKSQDEPPPGVIVISGDCIIDKITTNGAIHTKFGSVRKDGGTYTFESEIAYKLIVEKNGKTKELNFNENLVLEDGASIYLPTRPNEKITVKLIGATDTKDFTPPPPVIVISGDCIIDQKTTKGAIPIKFGSVKKDGGKYTFKSEAVYRLIVEKNGKIKELNSNESLVLEDGASIYLPIRPNEKITVKLV